MAKQQATTPSLELNAPTLAFLGMSQQPFMASILTGDAVYSDATRDQMIATLKHHMQFSDLVLIVEGEQGSGKTTLLRQLLQDNLPNLFLLPILPEPTDTLVQLQQKMTVHLKNQGSANYLDQDLKNLHVFDQFPIAVIDDAHILSDTTLQELIRYRSQLKRDKDTSLKILLFANPGMAKTLEDISELQHNQLYVQQMPELNPKQVQAFIDHRLTTAGYRGGALLPPETIQQIHKKSRGKPGQVMAMAALMLEKHVRTLSQTGNHALKKILFITSMSLMIAGGMYFAMNRMPAPAPQTIANEPVTATVEPAPVAELPPAAANQPADTNTTEQNLPPATGEQEAEPPAPDVSMETTSIAEHPAESTSTDAATSGIAPPATATTIDANTAATGIAQDAAPTPVAETAQALAGLAALGVNDSAWLRQQNPAHWTLQLLASNEAGTLLKFAREHKLGSESAWYETRRHDQPWYVLVHRIYTSADIARKGLTRLPPDLQQGKPWVKSIASIHKDIR
ncbi:MAG: DamX protein [Pseudomonadota bacterium]|nr:DamX protein [Pseudomonadota bacterium]